MAMDEVTEEDADGRTKWKWKIRQGRSVPYARTQVLPHRFDNLKKKINLIFFFFFLDFIRQISIMNQ